MKIGDKIRLKRRYSDLNGWSCAECWDGKIAEIIEIEDRINGSITAICEDKRLLFFRDAIGEVIPMDRGEG